MSLLNVWKKLTRLLKKHPVILGPFIAMAVIDLILLAVVFFAPQRPLSAVLAPVIRAFWGQRFLHYPANFLILPQLFNYARNIFSFITGVLLTGVAVSMLAQAYRNEKPRWWYGIKKSVKKYLRLAVVWGVIFICLVVAARFTSWLNQFTGSTKISLGIDFGANILIQMIFVFAIPSIIIENKKVLASIVRSLALFKRYFITTFLFVLIPGLLFVPYTVLHARLPFLMDKMFPEVVLYALLLRILILTVVDITIMSSASIVLMKHRELDKGVKRP